jgi:hypothetical protein
VPYSNINFTIPGDFWWFFSKNRGLERDLPVLAAKVLTSWARRHHKVDVYVLVILQTFGDRLNYHPHLHVLVSAGGVDMAGVWHAISFDHRELMPLWRRAILEYLASACGLPEFLNHVAC